MEETYIFPFLDDSLSEPSSNLESNLERNYLQNSCKNHAIDVYHDFDNFDNLDLNTILIEKYLNDDEFISTDELCNRSVQNQSYHYTLKNLMPY